MNEKYNGVKNAMKTGDKWLIKIKKENDKK